MTEKDALELAEYALIALHDASIKYGEAEPDGTSKYAEAAQIIYKSTDTMCKDAVEMAKLVKSQTFLNAAVQGIPVSDIPAYVSANCIIEKYERSGE